MSDPYPFGFEAKADNRSAQVIQIDMGKHLAAMVVLAVVCGVCAAITIVGAIHSSDREREVNNKLTISENHWRNFEVEQKALRAELTILEKDYAKPK